MLKKLTIQTLVILGLSSMAYADKVELSTDGTGDFLIAPLYIAKGDICSEIKVFNTNETSSILAKIAFREQISSHEVDFPIFLSPGDIWSGEVCQTKDGIVCLTSNDDSNHPSALRTLKYGQALSSHSKNAINRNNMATSYVEIEGKTYDIKETQKESIDYTRGYIEVFPIAQFYEGSTLKINKAVLVERWDALVRGTKNLKNISLVGVDSKSLSGQVSFKTSNQITSSIPMTAFKGTHDKQILGSAIDYNSNATAENLLGKGKKTEILKLLQNGTVSFTYNNAGKNQCLNILFPFTHTEQQKRSYKLVVRDMQENKYTMIFSPLPSMSNEIQILSVAELVGLTRDLIKFKEGMIQIKEITNINNVQLGKNSIASIIPTLSIINEINGKEIVINTTYLPVK